MSSIWIYRAQWKDKYKPQNINDNGRRKQNQDAVNTGNPTSAEGADTLTALKEEVAKLTEENKSLAETLKKTEYDRDIYKSLWSKADDKVSAMTDVLKEMIKLAKLGWILRICKRWPAAYAADF